MSFSGSFPICILSSRSITQKHQQTGISVTHIQRQKLIFILFSFRRMITINTYSAWQVHLYSSGRISTQWPPTLPHRILAKKISYSLQGVCDISKLHTLRIFFRLSFVSSSSLTPFLHRVRNHQGDIWRTIQEATAKTLQCGSKWQFRKWKILSAFLM